MGNVVTVGVHKCKIISGGCFGSEGKKYIIGGWGWAWCCVSQVDEVSLRMMTLKPSITSVETSEGVAVSCDGVAQVCIMKDPTMLALAAEQFVGMPDCDVEHIILQTIEGHLRAILGTMTVEQIFRDREGFAKKVREYAEPDVAKMGIRIISFVIQDVTDKVEYLHSLGVKQTAQVRRNADSGVASAKRTAGIACSEAEKVMMETKYHCDAMIAQNKRCYELKQAEHDQAVNASKAEAELAYQLQGARVEQKIKEERMQIEVVERRKQIDIEEHEITRKEKELYCSKRAPAEAEAQRVTILAEADRVKTLCYAGAEAIAIRAVGSAEAYQIEVIGKAEAEQMRQKAAAYAQYGDAAIMSLILDALPKIAAEVASPLGQIENVVMTSGGGRMSSDVRGLLAQLPPNLQAITGLDIHQKFEELKKPSSTPKKPRKLPSPPAPTPKKPTALSALIKKQSITTPPQPVTPPPPPVTTPLPPISDLSPPPVDPVDIIAEPRSNPQSRSHSTHSLHSEHTLIKVDSWEATEESPSGDFGAPINPAPRWNF